MAFAKGLILNARERIEKRGIRLDCRTMKKEHSRDISSQKRCLISYWGEATSYHMVIG